MVRKILCVDDEPNVLDAITRQLRRKFEIETAVGPRQGLEVLSAAGPFAVVVSDMRMPYMNGVQFLAQVRELQPDTVRVVLTGQADFEDAIGAVNQGNIFRFLTKPCPPEVLIPTLEAALEQFRLVHAERELLEKTLSGSVEMLSEILSLVSPTAFSRAHRIRHSVREMANKMELPDRWQFELAAMLSQIGCVAVPGDILDKVFTGEPLAADEKEQFRSHCKMGQTLLSKIPRLESVAAMVAGQLDPRASFPDGAAVDPTVSIGAQMLKVALDFDELTSRGHSRSTALTMMRDRREYDTALLGCMSAVMVEEPAEVVRAVKLSELRTRMIIAADVHAKNGLLLLAKGQEVTESVRARLLSFTMRVGVVEPIRVIIRRHANAAEQSPAQPAATGKS